MSAFGIIPGVGRGPSEGARTARESRQLNERARPTGGERDCDRQLEEEEGAGGYLCDEKAARGCAPARCPIGGTPNPAGSTPTSKLLEL